MPLILTFVDYEKPFNSVDTSAVLSALTDQGVDSLYMRALARCSSRCSATVKLFQRPLAILVKKDVTEGGTISLELFTAAPQCAMKSLDWDEKGIHVDGRCLRSADNIVLFSSNAVKDGDMRAELDEAGKKVGLRISQTKTQFIKNAWADEA
ncbi:unnamed protein product [Haemonchus placei]|uniref:Reverse transcriptase domain-containing protein n=1 Tax=Haemonchus placei TaxID=6290 RepID=A0A0N4WR25_HAEPC|nr:unnamed protein product [Haemonchus placei]